MTIVHFNDKNVNELNKYIKDKYTIFLLIYMEYCKPCMEVKPEWYKIENILKPNKKVIVGDIERNNLSKVTNLKYEVTSFPTILFLSKNGKIESYSDSKFQDRTIDSFMKWIISKCKSCHSKTHKKKLHGGKWSRKYKRSINCKRPRGFSQRQYCKSKKVRKTYH